MSFSAYIATLLCLYTLLASANAQGSSFLRTINVQGVGKATAPPDLATVNTGVTTNARTATKALADNNKKFQAVLNVLKKKGIAEIDVQTSFFDVFRSTSRRNGTRIVTYTVSNEVSVKVRDIDILGEVLDAVVSAGSNSISGVTFSLDDAKIPTEQARKSAIGDAKDRAQLYAKTAGVKVGKVLSISETVIQQPTSGDGGFGGFGGARRQASVPVSSGELDIEVQVFMLFELLG